MSNCHLYLFLLQFWLFLSFSMIDLLPMRVTAAKTLGIGVYFSGAAGFNDQFSIMRPFHQFSFNRSFFFFDFHAHAPFSIPTLSRFLVLLSAFFLPRKDQRLSHEKLFVICFSQSKLSFWPSIYDVLFKSLNLVYKCLPRRSCVILLINNHRCSMTLNNFSSKFSSALGPRWIISRYHSN